MSSPKKPFRKRRLFPRSLNEVVKDATKPLMTKQGKLMGALLADWQRIVGPERAAIARPERLQFPSKEASGAVLHLAVRPAAAPELAYATEQLLEQCARYFGYRAIARIVLHASYQGFTESEDARPKARAPSPKTPAPAPLPESIPKEMREILGRIATHVASASDKPESKR